MPFVPSGEEDGEVSRDAATTVNQTGTGINTSRFQGSPRALARIILEEIIRLRDDETLEQEENVVFVLDCKKCATKLCHRGMDVFLIADSSKNLYSTDYVTEQVEHDLTERSKGEYTIETCKCLIRDVICQACRSSVGYHVTMPCSSCMSAGTNGHYWLFHANAVNAKPRGLEPPADDNLPAKAADASKNNETAHADAGPSSQVEETTTVITGDGQVFVEEASSLRFIG